MGIGRGGKREGAGRKPSDDPKSIRKLYRFNKAEFDLIIKAVPLSQDSTEAEFVRNACLDKAKSIIANNKNQ